MSALEFVVTDEHVALLKRMYIVSGQWAPCVDQKRPYGNSDVDRDIHEILGWPPVQDEPWDEPEPDRERSQAIHEEMETVLQILVRNPGVDIRGRWVRANDWTADWYKEVG